MTRLRFRPRATGDAGPDATSMDATNLDATSLDAELLTAQGAAAPTALGELYRRHGEYVYAAAVQLVEPATAATVTHDTFLRCWNDRQSWAAGADTLREQLVSHARAVAKELRLAEPQLAADRGPDRVIDLLGSLPESEAAVVTLLAVGHCTFAEAARLLAQPDSQVRRQNARGLRALSLRLR